MKTILFLFLLDYSGSMYQKFDRHIKYETVFNNVRGLTQASRPDSQSAAFVFGTDNTKGCHDIKLIESETRSFARELFKLKPASYGQTPLAATLKKGIQYAINNDVQNVIAITDGGDSCKQNPCEELERGNELLKAANKKIKLILIGYDLNQDQIKFDCFKKLKLSHIDVEFFSITDAFELQQKLVELAEKSQANDRNELMNQMLKIKDPNLKNTKINNQKNKSKEEKNKIQIFDNSIEIRGAPADVEFTAIGKNEDKKWSGAFPVLVLPDNYKISASDPKTQNVLVQVEKGEKVVKYWSDFFKNTLVGVNYQANELGFEWKPTTQTKTIHSRVESFRIMGQLENKNEEKNIEFGEWEVDVISPVWLVGQLPRRKILIEPAEKLQIIEEYSDLIWINTPDSTKDWVIEIDFNEKKERYFIQAGVTRIPIVKNMKVSWLDGK